MTKKDFEAVARVLADNRPLSNRDQAWARRWERIVNQLGAAFAERNPRFCKVKWSTRCNGG